MCSEQGGTDLSIPAPCLCRHQILVEMISDGRDSLKQIKVKSPTVLQTPLLLPWHGLDLGSEAFETGLRKAEVETYNFLFSCSFCAHTSYAHSLLHFKLWYWQ